MTRAWIWEHPALASSILVGIGSIGTLYYYRSAVARSVCSWRMLSSVRRAENNIHIVTSEEGWAKVLPLLYKEAKHEGAVGFDCEWVQVKGHRRPVALLQLASCSGVCILLRLSNMKPNFPPSLRAFLEDETILKVGVGPLEDSSYLAADYGLKVRGCVDLRYLVLQCQKCESSSSSKVTECGKSPGNMGLNALAQKYLGRSLDKDWRVRASDWEADTLTRRQERYAAEDAVVGIHILITLLERLWVVSSPVVPFLPQTFWYHHLSKAIRQTCFGMIDVKFASSNKQQDTGMLQNKRSCPPAKMKISTRGNPLRKGPLYYNCQLVAPDDQPLCTIDPKKAWWYVEKDLGVLVSEDPLVVRLKFEPSGRPQAEKDDGRFYLLSRDNVCVVCGTDESFTRKNIVPHEYRKYFPDLLKHHQNHDVVLLCLACHRQSNRFDNVMRSQLAKEFNAPTGLDRDFKTAVNAGHKIVRNAAQALLNHQDNIPEKKVARLENIVKDFFKVEVLLPEHLKDAANMSVKVLGEGFLVHGEKVYKAYEKVGLTKLEQRWRQHFLETMKPQYMPECWSVNHNVYKMHLKIGRLPLDHPNRQIYKIALVGTDGTIDIPYNPQPNRESTPLDTSTAASRDPSPDYELPLLPILMDRDMFENTSASVYHSASLEKDNTEDNAALTCQKNSFRMINNDGYKMVTDETCHDCTSGIQEETENNRTFQVTDDSANVEMEALLHQADTRKGCNNEGEQDVANSN
ncbi:exonuclease 3'-5' domain-containing protein 2-like [Panulirus ornatus]|uniref:exonuclease 3'-5' domain-containing protein 2-like n=1 Tax=Panulirus ornatus TaxID=150431 RepID=UPI003A89BF22